MGVKKRAGRDKNPTYHHGDLRRALLDEAIVMLEADGRAEFSLRDLARRLGVSHGAPSHHFKDKAALVDAIATAGFIGLADALVECSALPVSPSERLTAAGVAYVRFAVSHPAHVRSMFGNAAAADPSEACVRESARAFGALVALAREAAGPRATERDVRAATFTAWSSVHGLALLWLDGEGPVRTTTGGTVKGLLALAADVSKLLARAVAELGRARD